MNPGQGPLCRGCRFFLEPAWHRGHPSPCRLFGWTGNVHHSPALSEDGSQCHDYRDNGQKTRSKNHGLRTKCVKKRHGADAPSPDIGDSAAAELPMRPAPSAELPCPAGAAIFPVARAPSVEPPSLDREKSSDLPVPHR